MASRTSLDLLCNYGGNDFNKDLKITPEALTVTSGEQVTLHIRLPDVGRAVFSANYLKLITHDGSAYVFRGIKPRGHNPLVHRNSMSDPTALKTVRSYLESRGVATSFKFIIMDGKVTRFLVVGLAGFALVLVTVFLLQA